MQIENMALMVQLKFTNDIWTLSGSVVAMSNQTIFENLESILDELTHINVEVENKMDRLVLNKAKELIDSVAWKYEEEQ